MQNRGSNTKAGCVSDLKYAIYKHGCGNSGEMFRYNFSNRATASVLKINMDNITNGCAVINTDANIIILEEEIDFVNIDTSSNQSEERDLYILCAEHLFPESMSIKIYNNGGTTILSNRLNKPGIDILINDESVHYADGVYFQANDELCREVLGFFPNVFAEERVYGF